MSKNREKEPLTYTVGDTAFGEALRVVAERQQNPGENRDKNNGGRRHRPSRKDQNMSTPDKQPSPNTNGGEKKDIAPAGGSKSKKFLTSSVEVGGELVHNTAKGFAWGLGAGLGGGAGLISAYCAAKALGAPIP